MDPGASGDHIEHPDESPVQELSTSPENGQGDVYEDALQEQQDEDAPTLEELDNPEEGLQERVEEDVAAMNQQFQAVEPDEYPREDEVYNMEGEDSNGEEILEDYDDEENDVNLEVRAGEIVQLVENQERGNRPHGIMHILHRLPRFLRRLRRHQYGEIFQNFRLRVQDIDNEEEMSNLERPTGITFDQSLPTSHLYLGELEDCSGVQYIDQETFITLPILRIQDFILVPGQTLPLNISRPLDMSLMGAVMRSDSKTFGVLMLKSHYEEGGPTTVDVGCTAELRSMRHEVVYEVPTLVGLAIGRQRFRVKENRRQPDGNLVAKVQILSDDILPPPAFGARLGIHHKLHLEPIAKAVQEGKQRNFTKKQRCRHQAQAAWLTPWPDWVYNMYDVRILRRELIIELKEWNQDLDENTLPTSPSEFSFWVACHLLITSQMRLYLMKIESSIQRMRCELDLIRRCTVYTCSDCGNQITDKRDVFSMSHSGPMAAYVNPSGHIHETLTVYKSSGLVHVSRDSTEHSWFPGYAWAICECRQCGHHMGWRFTATRDDLIPRKFWGLTRSGLAPKMFPDSQDDDAEGVPENLSRRRMSSMSSTSSASSHSMATWRPII